MSKYCLKNNNAVLSFTFEFMNETTLDLLSHLVLMSSKLCK